MRTHTYFKGIFPNHPSDQQKTPDQHRAFSLIESAIVLAVLGLVIGGIWIASTAVSEHFKVTRAAQAIVRVATGMQQLFTQPETYPTAVYDGTNGKLNVNGTVKSAGLIPPELINGTTPQFLPGTSWTLLLTGPLVAQGLDRTVAILGWSTDAALSTQLINAVVTAAKGELAYADCWDGVDTNSRVKWRINDGMSTTVLTCPAGANSTHETLMGFYFRTISK